MQRSAETQSPVDHGVVQWITVERHFFVRVRLNDLRHDALNIPCRNECFETVFLGLFEFALLAGKGICPFKGNIGSGAGTAKSAMGIVSNFTAASAMDCLNDLRCVFSWNKNRELIMCHFRRSWFDKRNIR